MTLNQVKIFGGEKMKDSFSRKKRTVLLLFGIIGQIAWSVENMYFNLFVFDTYKAPRLFKKDREFEMNQNGSLQLSVLFVL